MSPPSSLASAVSSPLLVSSPGSVVPVLPLSTVLAPVPLPDASGQDEPMQSSAE
jgi:hypothetical protein